MIERILTVENILGPAFFERSGEERRYGPTKAQQLQRLQRSSYFEVRLFTKQRLAEYADAMGYPPTAGETFIREVISFLR